MMVLQDKPTTATLRQAALNDSLNMLANGLNTMDEAAKTKRAEALAIQDQTKKLRDAGYDVKEDVVKQNMAPEPSGLAKFFGAESPERADLFANRTEEYKQEQINKDKDREQKLAEFKLDKSYKKSQIDATYASAQKSKAEAIKAQNESTVGKQISASDIAKFDEGNQIPTMLQDVKATIESNKDSFGPVAGRIAGLNPWDEQGQAIESQVTASAQAFGKFMEGGVLRAEDVPKYRKMFPNQSDTPETASNKLANVERLLAQKQNSTIGALKGAGYDVSSIDKGLKIPDVPTVITNKNPQISNNARAADPTQLKAHLKTISREEKIKMLQGQ